MPIHSSKKMPGLNSIQGFSFGVLLSVYITSQDSENKAIKATDGILSSTTSDDHPVIDATHHFQPNYIIAQDILAF